MALFMEEKVEYLLFFIGTDDTQVCCASKELFTELR